MKKVLFLLAVLLVSLGILWTPIFAQDDCQQVYENSGHNNQYYADCIGHQIDKLNSDLQASLAATTPLQSEVDRLDKQIKSIQAQITAAVKRTQDLSASISRREKDIAVQTLLLGQKSRQYYKMLRMRSPLVLLLSDSGTGELSRRLGYQETAAQKNRSLIISLANEIGQLEQDKKDVDENRVRLASLQTSLDKQASFFKGEIAKARDYQSSLTGKIAQLSALQQSILSQKSETFQTTVGDVPLADDPASRPDYNPGFSPAFAAFSFGAPHFKGMSQYGAYGRAKAGQNVEDILRAYYGGGIEIKKDYSTSINIHVSGHGTVDIETYVKRIYEMPNSWGDKGGFEALKAQAVAARSYALAYTNNGSGSICATESCQVYKSANKGGRWEEAVNATRGWVMMAGGRPLSAWYASTSGGHQMSYTTNGYTTPAFWDTPSGRAGWTSQAYEKTADDPWFYKGWYRSRSGDSCGRSHPWLTGEEMADILNAWVVVVKNGQSDSRVIPQGSCWGGNPYSLSQLRDRANGSGGGYSRVDSVNQPSYSSDGYTESVTFQTDRGSVTIVGSEFKKAFNLRAPGRISLKSGLFNIEKK